MFRCGITKRCSRPGEKANKIVIATRKKTYYGWIRNEETGELEQVEIGHGSEIVSEVNATEEGVRIWTQMQAQKLNS